MARPLILGVIAMLAASPALADDDVIDLDAHDNDDASLDDFIDAFGEDAVKTDDAEEEEAEVEPEPVEVVDDSEGDAFEDYDAKEAKVDALIEDFDDLDDEDMDFGLEDPSLDGFGPSGDDDDFAGEDLDDLDMDLTGRSSRPAVDDAEAAIIDEYGLEEGMEDLDGGGGFDDDFDDFGPAEDLDGVEGMGDMDLLDEPSEAELARENIKPDDFGLDMREARVMGDSWDGQVLEKGKDAVVVQLPVLVAKDEMDYAGEETWLVARFIANGAGAGEQRHLIAAETIAPVSPTIVWVTAHVPVDRSRGEIEVRVYQAFDDGEEVGLFDRVIRY